MQYGGGAAKGMGTVGAVAGLQMGKRRGMSDVCWHPEQVGHAETRLISGDAIDHCFGGRRVADYHALGFEKYSSTRKGEPKCDRPNARF